MSKSAAEWVKARERDEDCERFGTDEDYVQAIIDDARAGMVPEAERFPVIGGGSIPWSIAEAAFIGYAAKYGSSQSLRRLAERGGFAVGELDEYWPTWRAAVDEAELAKAWKAGRDAAAEFMEGKSLASMGSFSDRVRALQPPGGKPK